MHIVMLQNIKQFFDRHIHKVAGAQGRDAQHALQVATAALLFEVMRTDSELKDSERRAIRTAVETHFSLTPGETADLLHLAETQAAQATDYYQFTSLINEHFTAIQKEQVIENMWHVAAADLEIDRFERTLVHKVGDLLHVPRPVQIATRERALEAARRKSQN